MKFLERLEGKIEIISILASIACLALKSFEINELAHAEIDSANAQTRWIFFGLAITIINLEWLALRTGFKHILPIDYPDLTRRLFISTILFIIVGLLWFLTPFIQQKIYYRLIRVYGVCPIIKIEPRYGTHIKEGHIQPDDHLAVIVDDARVFFDCPPKGKILITLTGDNIPALHREYPLPSAFDQEETKGISTVIDAPLGVLMHEREAASREFNILAVVKNKYGASEEHNTKITITSPFTILQ